MDFKEGDLVFVHGKVTDYIITVPGSWGYVVKPNSSYVTVDFKHYGPGSNSPDGYNDYTHALRILRIAKQNLKRIPNPPKTKEEITELVADLTKLTS